MTDPSIDIDRWLRGDGPRPEDQRNEARSVYHVRPGRASDIGFVFKTWSRSYRAGGINRLEQDAGFARAHRHVMGRLIEDAQLYVAAWDDDPEFIVGWMLGEQFRVPSLDNDRRWLLHYVYVRKAWRRLGVARILLRRLCAGTEPDPRKVALTHLTNHMAQYAKSRGFGLALRLPAYRTILHERTHNE